MSVTIQTVLSGTLPERLAPSVDARERSSGAQTWRAAFEQAGGESFGGWFQAPADQPDAGASPGAAPLPPTRAPMPAMSMTPVGRAGLALTPTDGSVRERPTDRAHNSAAAPSTPAAGTRDTSSALGSAGTAAPVSSNIEPDVTFVPTSMDTLVLGAMNSPPAAAQLAAAMTLLLGTAVSPVVDAVDAGAPETVNGTQATLAAAPAAGDPEEAAAKADDAAPASTPSPAREADTDEGRDGLRLHAEWTDTGVRIWLGVDAQNLPDVATLTSQLQHWLVSQGSSLLGLVCNGRDLLSDSSTPRDGASAPRAARRSDAAMPQFDFSNLYPSETR